MTKTKDSLITQINSLIKANGKNEITGPILNGVLRDMTDGLVTPYFLFPKHAALSEYDIGKVVSNDGSGLAKVYAYSPATTAQTGEWQITFADNGDLTEFSTIEIISVVGEFEIDRDTWRDGGTPANVEEELAAIALYINNDATLSTFLSATATPTELTIEETVLKGTTIALDNFPPESLEVVTVSRPALPAAPTAFPLGKLIGIDGSNAIISSNVIQTYILDGALTVNNGFFNIMTPMDVSDPVSLAEELLSHIVIPSANGNARALTQDDFIIEIDGETVDVSLTFRHQFLGFALAASGGTVTVYDLKQISFFTSVILNLLIKSFEASEV